MDGNHRLWNEPNGNERGKVGTKKTFAWVRLPFLIPPSTFDSNGRDLTCLFGREDIIHFFVFSSPHQLLTRPIHATHTTHIMLHDRFQSASAFMASNKKLSLPTATKLAVTSDFTTHDECKTKA